VASKIGFTHLIAVLEAGQATGELRSEPAVGPAKVLWSLVHGIAVLLVDNQFADAATADRDAYGDALAREAVRNLVEGLARRT
jgi:hypothetical protein